MFEKGQESVEINAKPEIERERVDFIQSPQYLAMTDEMRMRTEASYRTVMNYTRLALPWFRDVVVKNGSNPEMDVKVANEVHDVVWLAINHYFGVQEVGKNEMSEVRESDETQVERE